MIKVTDLSFGFPQKDLYNEVCFEIEEGDHAVLIGSNGTGKSTLIDMLMDTEKYLYEGEIEETDVGHIGLVKQFVRHEAGEYSVYDFLNEPFLEMQAALDKACDAMSSGEGDMDALFAEYQECQDRMDAADAYNADTNIRKMLSSAGLEELTDRSVSLISGGEYKLLSIIRNMLLKPHLLIMDEPDVFLDFDNLVGLTRLINHYRGTVLVITHNRLLLHQCFNKVLHLENMELQEFPGTYAEYMSSLLETKIEMKEQAAKDEEWIEVQEKLVERLREKSANFISASLGRQLKARVSYLERLQARKTKNPFIEEHEYGFRFPEVSSTSGETEWTEATGSETGAGNEEKMSAATASLKNSAAGTRTAPETSASVESSVAVAQASPKIPAPPAISVQHYSLAFEKPLLSDVSFEILPGEKVAVVGANGTGKSSMLRDLYEKLQHGPDGEKYRGKIAMFSQIYDDDSQTLSGGERNIQQLREIMESEASILFLDEPTSHLDTWAQRALEDALEDYKGTVLMVSHDFFTITNCSDRVLMLENGTVRQMSGRAYRKQVYSRWFDSDIFAAERKRKEEERRINQLIRKGRPQDARKIWEQMNN